MGKRITLRQLLDCGLFLQKESSNVNWHNIIPFLKEVGTWTFFNQIGAISEDYFGLQFKRGFELVPNAQLKLHIIEDILHSGFCEEKPEKLLLVFWFKMKRWWYYR